MYIDQLVTVMRCGSTKVELSDILVVQPMMKCIHWYSTVAQLRWNLSLPGKSVVQLGMGRGSTWNKLMWKKLWLNLEQVNVDKVVAQLGTS